MVVGQDKLLCKVELLLLKIIPMVLSLIYFSNTILSYCDIDVGFLSIIGGVGVIPLLFLYISSYVFKFCEYHRMFLHYIVANNLITYYDYYIGIPITNKKFLSLNLILYFILLIFVLYLYLKSKVCLNR